MDLEPPPSVTSRRRSSGVGSSSEERETRHKYVRSREQKERNKEAQKIWRLRKRQEEADLRGALASAQKRSACLESTVAALAQENHSLAAQVLNLTQLLLSMSAQTQSALPAETPAPEPAAHPQVAQMPAVPFPLEGPLVDLPAPPQIVPGAHRAFEAQHAAADAGFPAQPAHYYSLDGFLPELEGAELVEAAGLLPEESRRNWNPYTVREVFPGFFHPWDGFSPGAVAALDVLLNHLAEPAPPEATGAGRAAVCRGPVPPVSVTEEAAVCRGPVPPVSVTEEAAGAAAALAGDQLGQAGTGLLAPPAGHPAFPSPPVSPSALHAPSFPYPDLYALLVPTPPQAYADLPPALRRSFLDLLPAQITERDSPCLVLRAKLRETRRFLLKVEGGEVDVGEVLDGLEGTEESYKNAMCAEMLRSIGVAAGN